jgi:hypothetical protein
MTGGAALRDRDPVAERWFCTINRRSRPLQRVPPRSWRELSTRSCRRILEISTSALQLLRERLGDADARPYLFFGRKQLNDCITNIRQISANGRAAARLLKWRILESVYISAHVIYAMLTQEALNPFVECVPCLVGGEALSKTLELGLKRSIEHIWSPPVIRTLPAIVSISSSLGFRRSGKYHARRLCRCS